MNEKKYTSEDIPVLMPKGNQVELVDISKDAFEKNLKDASAKAFEFAKILVIDDLPDPITFVVRLDASYDGFKVYAAEEIPNSNKDGVNFLRKFLSVQEVVRLLWKEGKVPEWVNVYVESFSDNCTNIRLDCCGRYTDSKEKIYHVNERIAPFHVLGPPRPQGVKKGEKFSIRRNNLGTTPNSKLE